MIPLEEVLRSIDQFSIDQEFTTDDLIEVTGVSKSVMATCLPKLVGQRLVTRIEGTKPYRYKRGDGVLLMDMFRAGEFEGFWSDRGRWTRGQTGRRLKGGGSVPDPEEIVEELEIDPLEVFEQMGPDDFSRLVSVYLKTKQGEIGPLKDQVAHLETEVRFLNGKVVQEAQRHSSEINGLREELRAERERVINLQTELNKEKGLRVAGEDRVKTILIERRGGVQKDSGGQGVPGAAFNSIKVHRKPLMHHPPASVIHRKRR